ncbi:hypothetical protein FISHEDRAFT_55471 [Fistulina hepatica ATCC 64428]|uniref:C2H2-type domain-containing protein n=1 Tax=Fistulina hepatica ATCC 64428 TaxID=1128425 RepID=A0A0D7AMZ5_9AGAR|nr:hypothetical protein FISHEDRAFT_55471 [Fistulina hepatica ATCC 64428]
MAHALVCSTPLDSGIYSFNTHTQPSDSSVSSLLSLSIVAASAAPIPVDHISAPVTSPSGGADTALPASSARQSASPPYVAPRGYGHYASTKSHAEDVAGDLRSSDEPHLFAAPRPNTFPLCPSWEEDTKVTVAEPVIMQRNNAIATYAAKQSGKKRGKDYRCETCNKVYRHPSCLIKHRWEHTPHWREASKYVAAAILSHLSPSSSLPEDRSLWPSFLSGGSLSPDNAASSVEVSSSAPTPERRPRLHDYSIGPAAGNIVFRPGIVGVPTGPDKTEAAEGSRSPALPDGPTVLLSPSRTRPVAVPLSRASGTRGASSASSGIYPRDSPFSYESSVPGLSYGDRGGSMSRSLSYSDDESVDVEVDDTDHVIVQANSKERDLWGSVGDAMDIDMDMDWSS